MKIAKIALMTKVIRSNYMNQISWANPEEVEREFNNWVEAVAQTAAEKAWDEGFQACAEWWEIHHWQHSGAAEDNPYRLEEGTT